jgi:hypothetical protein
MKVLRLSDLHDPIENSLRSITKLVPGLEDYYLFGKDEEIDINSYSAVWCTTSIHFKEATYPCIFKALNSYTGKTVNWRCATSLGQDVMTRRWIESDIPSPDFIKYKAGVIDDPLPSFWKFPLMIKAAREYPRVSFATVVNNQEEYVKWVTTHNFDYILQRYIPFEEEDSLYYCGQVYIVGEKVIPRSTRWSNHWYVSPTDRGMPHLGLEMGGHTSIPSFSHCADFEEQVKKIASTTDVDIGTLDFSLTDSGKVIPWGICTVYPNYTEGKQSRREGRILPSALEQVPIQVQGWNEILFHLGIDFVVTSNMMWRSIHECGLDL